MKIKFSVAICVILFYSVAVRADDWHRSCDQYLKTKGILERIFTSTEAVLQYQHQCREAMPFLTRNSRQNIEYDIEDELPEQEYCLKKQISNIRFLDAIYEIDLLSNRQENEPDIKISGYLALAKKDLKKTLDEIAIHCEVGGTFFSLFNQYLVVKNETLAALESYYCFTKYTADNKLLPLDDFDLNTNKINIEAINCSSVIQIEQKGFVEALRNHLGSLPPAAISCVMDSSEGEKLFDVQIAENVLAKIDLPRETKDAENRKISQQTSQFVEAMTSCRVANTT